MLRKEFPGNLLWLHLLGTSSPGCTVQFVSELFVSKIWNGASGVGVCGKQRSELYKALGSKTTFENEISANVFVSEDSVQHFTCWQHSLLEDLNAHKKQLIQSLQLPCEEDQVNLLEKSNTIHLCKLIPGTSHPMVQFKGSSRANHPPTQCT